MVAQFHLGSFCAPGGLRPLSDNEFQPCFVIVLGLALDGWLFAAAAYRFFTIRQFQPSTYARSRWWRTARLCAIGLAVLHLVLLLSDSLIADDLYLSNIVQRLVTAPAWACIAALLVVENNRGLVPGASIRSAWGATCALSVLEMLTRLHPSALIVTSLPLFVLHLILGFLGLMPQPARPALDDGLGTDESGDSLLASFGRVFRGSLRRRTDSEEAAGVSINAAVQPLVISSSSSSRLLNDSDSGMASSATRSAAGRPIPVDDGDDNEVWGKLIGFHSMTPTSSYLAPILSPDASSRKCPANPLGVAVFVESVDIPSRGRAVYAIRVRRHVPQRDGNGEGESPENRAAAEAVRIEGAVDSATGVVIQRSWGELDRLHCDLQAVRTGGHAGVVPKFVLPPMPPNPAAARSLSGRDLTRAAQETSDLFRQLLREPCTASPILGRFLGVTLDQDVLSSLLNRAGPGVVSFDPTVRRPRSPTRPSSGGSDAGSPEDPATLASSRAAPYSPSLPVPVPVQGSSASQTASDAQSHSQNAAVPTSGSAVSHHDPPPLPPGHGDFVVSVPSWELSTEGAGDGADGDLGKSHTIYVVEVWLEGVRHVVRKRFRHVAALHTILSDRYPRGVRPILPARWAGALGPLGKGEALNDERRAGLEWYLRALVASNFRAVPELEQFFGLGPLGQHSWLGRLQVSVPDYAQAGDHVDFRVVAVDLVTGRKSEARHRYSEFVALQASARRMVCSQPVPDLPGRTLLAMGSSAAERDLEKRRVGLEAFMESLVTRLGHVQTVLDFVGMSSTTGVQSLELQPEAEGTAVPGSYVDSETYLNG